MISEIPFLDGMTILGRSGISTFSIFLLAGFLSATAFLRRELARRGLRSELADPILLITLVSSIIGSKVFYVWEVWGKIWLVDIGFWDTFTRVFFSWAGMSHLGGYGFWPTLLSGGGLVFYGGLVFATASVYWYLRKEKLEIWKYGDSIFLMLALGYGFGRLGCFVSGDGCFGHAAPVDIPLLTWIYGPTDGLCPTDPNLSWQYPLICTFGIRVWNTPLLEAAVAFAFFAIGMIKLRKIDFRPGMMTALMLIVNGTTRFFVEFLRVNDALIPMLKPPSVVIDGVRRPLSHFANHQDLLSLSQGTISSEKLFFEHWHWYGITQSQLIALVLVVASAIWIYKGKLYKRGSEKNEQNQNEQKQKNANPPPPQKNTGQATAQASTSASASAAQTSTSASATIARSKNSSRKKRRRRKK